jgi:hypothetical protein
MATEGVAYPVTFDVDYPEQQSRWVTLFRLILAIPVYIPASIINGAVGSIGQFAFVTILFRKKYPRWAFDFLAVGYRYYYGALAYLLLLRDEYGPFDDIGTVRVDFEYPEKLNRWLPLVKWLLAIPHYIVLYLLWIVYVIVLIIAWFAILITGKHPRALFDFGVAVNRWSLRVTAYAFALTTDQYPPFSFR